MATHWIKLSWIIGVAFALIFVFLFSLRLGIFQKREAGFGEDRPFHAQTQMDRETWMNIFQQGQKIGYAHRQFYKTDEGYKILESVFMQINTMGMVQDIRYKTEGHFHHNLTLSDFNFDLQSSLFRFKAYGVVKERTLTLTTSTSGSEQKIDIPLERELHLPIGLLETLNAENLRPGDTRTFQVFDPTTAAQRPVKVVMLAEEIIPIMGRQENAKKVSVDLMGVSQFAWIGKEGTVLKEEGSLGIKLEQVTKEEALQKVDLLPNMDLAEIASIPVNQVLQDVDRLIELKLRLDGIGGKDIFLNGGRQSQKGKVLTIRRESIANLSPQKISERFPEEIKTYLEPSLFIQSDHPEIQAKAKEIVSPDDSAVVKAYKLIAWVNKNIQKKPVVSVPNALETLRNQVGDCNEHAVLYAALARAAGIPAQVEAGLVYQNRRFYYHAWNVIYLGTWITVDPVMGQLPADVTHIRFARGTERQIDLIRMIGKVKLEILSAS
jgi:transglutaminase-like putative cysteine protease